MPSEDVNALAFGRSSLSTLYAAAGVRGYIYVSADGANSWTRAGESQLFSGLKRRLFVAPKDGQIIFAVANPGGAGPQS